MPNLTRICMNASHGSSRYPDILWLIPKVLKIFKNTRAQSAIAAKKVVCESEQGRFSRCTLKFSLVYDHVHEDWALKTPGTIYVDHQANRMERSCLVMVSLSIRRIQHQHTIRRLSHRWLPSLSFLASPGFFFKLYLSQFQGRGRSCSRHLLDRLHTRTPRSSLI